MTDQPVTASAIISFSEQLEDSSERFYQELGQRFPAHRELFDGFARDCAKNRVQVTRTYQETITDALEGCFAFEGFKFDNYRVDLTLSEGIALFEGTKIAIALEEKAVAFYLDAAERSESLLATIPGAFRRVARRRSTHKDALEASHD